MLGVADEPIHVNTSSTSRSLQQHLFYLLCNCKTTRTLLQIHTQIIINGFSQKNFILAKLLTLYVTRGHLISAQAVFENLKNPSTNLWNQMIRCYDRGEMPQKFIRLFNQMVATGAEPDGFTYSYLLHGCARFGLVREGEQFHGRVLANGYRSSVFVETNLINFYAMTGGVEFARRMFDDMGERNVVTWNSMLAGYMRSGNVDGATRIFHDMPERNLVSWTTMILGYVRNGNCRQALFLFREMRRAGVEFDRVVLIAALLACAGLGNLTVGRWIHLHAEKILSDKTSQEILVSFNNALIRMYASCGAIREAYKVFRWMEQRSTVSWTSMITAYAKQGYAQEAIALFQWMESLGTNHVKPDAITFIGVLGACSHAGMVSEGRQLFQSMTQTWGIEPRIEHYGCMVDLLSRAGLLDEAKHLVETMPMKPNDAVWGALLGGCRIHKNAELASHVAKNLIVELNPDRVAGYLVLLAHVYATVEMWQEVSIIKQRVVEIGTRKPAGRSWVQINGTIHDFVAGDRLHKDVCSVHETLGKITGEAK